MPEKPKIRLILADDHAIVRAGIREAICVPMQGRYGVVGVIYIDTYTAPGRFIQRPANRFSEEHLKLMVAIGHQAALAVEDTSYYKAMVQAERLAGRPASVAWEAEGTRLVVEIPEAGQADLELAFRPQVERSDGMVRCEVLIPRVPNSGLRLQLPKQVSEVDCPTALGAATTDAAGERVQRAVRQDALSWAGLPAALAAPTAVGFKRGIRL